MAPHSRTLAWKIPWMEEPGRLRSMGSLRVGHDWAPSLSLFTFLHWRRKWQPTPVFLPGESQGQGSLVGCRLWDCTELDTTEVTWQQQQSILSPSQPLTVCSLWRDYPCVLRSMEHTVQMVLPIDQPCWQHDTTTVLEKDGYIYYSDTVGLTRPVKPLGFYMVISLLTLSSNY